MCATYAQVCRVPPTMKYQEGLNDLVIVPQQGANTTGSTTLVRCQYMYDGTDWEPVLTSPVAAILCEVHMQCTQ